MSGSTAKVNGDAARAATGDGPGCIARIQSSFQDFTPAERRIAETVLADPDGLVLASVTDFAGRSGGSEAAVSRFARKLGYGSFAEFKLALSRDIAPTGRPVHGDVELGDDTETVVAKVAAGNIRAIDDAVRRVDQAALAEAARRISAANRVAFCGFAGSAIAAQDAMNHFVRAIPNAFHFVDPHEQTIWASLCGSGDVLVLCSHSGSSRDLLELAQLAVDRGAFVIAITNQGGNALAEIAQLNLHTSTREGRFREEALTSRIATLTLIDILYVLVALQRPEEMAERGEAIRDAIDSKRVSGPRTGSLSAPVRVRP
ncbi:MAG: MurR/RpiR family transcriptional regulator [Actinobacteria bacterium]|nr:MurR/RpiR family transcriptional regulator [Actinomycetota bacterium]